MKAYMLNAYTIALGHGEALYRLQARIGEGPIVERDVTLSPYQLATAIVQIAR